MKLPSLDKMTSMHLPKKLAGIIIAARKGAKMAQVKKIGLKFGNLGK